MVSPVRAINQMRQNPCPEIYLKSLQWQSSVSQFCSSLGPNGKFWSSYIDIVDLLLQFIRSTREAGWNLHIQCLLEMMSWFAANDRINYARYLPAYVLQMMTIPESHPDAHTFIINGEFAVQSSTGNSFGRIPHDHTIEVTANRDTKSRGGIVGITLKNGTVLK